jgi:nitronate monooxygenase
MQATTREVISEARARLGIQHPIIQGPFGGGLSTVQLVSSVSNLGGLGSFGAYNVPPGDIAALVRDLKSSTSRPFAINLWVSDRDHGADSLTREQLRRHAEVLQQFYAELGLQAQRDPPHLNSFADQAHALIESEPPAFSFVFGVPAPDILKACRQRGIVTIGTATSIAEARALDEARVDIIVASGFEAGGHRPSFLRPPEASLIGTFALTQLLARRVSAPVVAAGGIVNAQGVTAALALGAAGVQLGTAFLACEESGTTPEHREALFSTRAEETVLTRAYTGRLARGIPNRLTEALTGKDQDFAPFPVHGHLVAPLRAASRSARRDDFLSLYAGQAAPNLEHRSAEALMRALIPAIN